MPESVEKMLLPSGYYHNLPTDSSEQKNNPSSAMNSSEQAINIKQLRSFYNSPCLETIKNLTPDGKAKIF